MKAKLVIVGADIKPSEYRLKLPAVIGRGKEATLKLVHSLVSRAHCEIFELDGQLMVRDLGSLNGTFIAGQRIEDTVPLPSGELITIGSVTFRADYGHSDVFLLPPKGAAASTGDTTDLSKMNDTVHTTGHEAAGDSALSWLSDDEPAASADNSAGEADDATETEDDANEFAPGESEQHGHGAKGGDDDWDSFFENLK